MKITLLFVRHCIKAFVKQNLIFFIVILVFSIIFQAEAYEGIEISQAEDLLASAAAPLANLEGEPSATVHGCVNALTGDFYEAQVDLVLPGSDPFILERFYCSSDRQNGLLYHGWNHNLGGSFYSLLGSVNSTSFRPRELSRGLKKVKLTKPSIII